MDTQNNSGALIILLILLHNIRYVGNENNTSLSLNKVVLKIKPGETLIVNQTMAEFNFTFYRQILDDVYTYSKTPMYWTLDTNVDAIRQKLSGKIQYVFLSTNIDVSTHSEPTDDVPIKLPMVGLETSGGTTSDSRVNTRLGGQECAPVFDPMFGIDDAWKQNITGTGIVIAIVDVGVDQHHPKLQRNINTTLSWNCVDNNLQFGPEYYPHIPSSTLLTNHGNACAGLAAGNNDQSNHCQSCGCGVAPDATIAVIKVGTVPEVVFRFPSPQPAINDETLAYGLRLHSAEIDIYSTSLNFNNIFQEVQQYIKEVMQTNYCEGRNYKGSIMVFPADPPGNGFVNNIYTIAVGDMGVNGTLPENHQTNSAVLVSVFRSGRLRNDTRFVTDIHEKTIKNGRCCLYGEFGGQSATTPIVSAMIALVLQANPCLTARDVKHILVKSASSAHIAEQSSFKTNAAGHRYHKVFGFGYPDVTKMISLARSWTALPPIRSKTFTCKGRCNSKTVIVSNGPIKTTEQIEIHVQFHIPKDINTSMVVVSPRNTESVLFENVMVSDNQKVRTNFLSNHFWGEDPSRLWTLLLVTNHSTLFEQLCIHEVELTIHGTNISHTGLYSACSQNNIYDSQTNCPIPKNKMNEFLSAASPILEMDIKCLALTVVVLRMLIL